MKNHLTISVILLLEIFLSCSTSETGTKNNPMILDELPNLNNLFHPRGVPDFSLLISSSELSNAYSVNCKNINYYVAVNDFKKVIYISTDDESFVTSEKLNINSTLSDVRNITDNDISIEKGWAFFIPLESGWNAAFVKGESMTDGILDMDSKISFFFKK
ncbi:MAG: hypothetical protein IPH97_17595 [Ignavibacteriales bacterium]|nr:hypothetical protein [Ignavibacteriales bacterium]